jgi:hypothetical protein
VRRLLFARDDVVAELALRGVSVYICPPTVPFKFKDSGLDVEGFPKDAPEGDSDPLLSFQHKSPLSLSLVWVFEGASVCA